MQFWTSQSSGYKFYSNGTGDETNELFALNASGNATFAGTVTAADLLTVNGDGHLFLGADGETPKIDMMYVDSASGLGWDTRIFIGSTDDLPNAQSFPTSTIAGGFGTQYQANSDGAFFGIIPRATGHYRPVINWGDDADDTPFSFQFNGTNIVDVSSTGTVTATNFIGSSGAFLPLAAGAGSPLTGNLVINSTSSAIPVLLLNAAGNANCDITMQSTNTSSVTRLRTGVNDFQIHTNGSQQVTVNSAGNVGIGTPNPTSKLDVTNGAGKFCVDSKTHNLTNAFTTCLTVNLNSHTGCYVTLTCFGDWGAHSAAAYRGEFFLQNGANGYAEPGIILRQDDNTSNGTDQIVCQIVDPAGSGNPKDFEIQIRTTATTGTTGFTGQLTYTVQGKFNSIT